MTEEQLKELEAREAHHLRADTWTFGGARSHATCEMLDEAARGIEREILAGDQAALAQFIARAVLILAEPQRRMLEKPRWAK